MLSKTIWNSDQITHWPRNRAAGSHLSMTATEETETPSTEITGHNTLLLWSMAKQFQCALSLEYNKWQLRVASSGFSIRFSSFQIVKQSTHTHRLSQPSHKVPLSLSLRRRSLLPDPPPLPHSCRWVSKCTNFNDTYTTLSQHPQQQQKLQMNLLLLLSST